MYAIVYCIISVHKFPSCVNKQWYEISQKNPIPDFDIKLIWERVHNNKHFFEQLFVKSVFVSGQTCRAAVTSAHQSHGVRCRWLFETNKCWSLSTWANLLMTPTWLYVKTVCSPFIWKYNFTDTRLNKTSLERCIGHPENQTVLVFFIWKKVWQFLCNGYNK